MKVNSIKELRAVAKLCRELGIDKITIDGISFELGTLPQKASKSVETKDDKNTTAPTEEDMLFWSAQ